MENDKELCTSKIQDMAKNSYKTLKSFLKDNTNQKIFFTVIFAFIFAILIGIVIGSKENYSMSKVILLCVIVCIPISLLAVMFPKQVIAILSVFILTLIIMGNRVTDTVYNIGFTITDSIVWLINNISNITLKFFKIDINFQENLTSREQVDSSYDSRRLQTQQQYTDSNGISREVITNVIDTYKTNQEKEMMKQIKQDIIQMENDINNILDLYVNNIESNTSSNEDEQTIEYKSNTYTMKELRELYESKMETLNNKKREFQDTYGKHDIIRFDLKGNKIPSTLPIYNRVNKYAYGSENYIPSYEDQVMLSTSSKNNKPSTNFISYEHNSCLVYDKFSNTL